MIFLGLAFLLTTVPFLYISRYNHPSADDFCYASKVNFFGLISTQIDHWNIWSGRYMATLLLSIISIDTGDLMNYRVIPVLLFIFFGLSIFVFFKSLIPKASTYDICVLSFVIFFLYILKAPNITEAFYWLAGSVTYQLASILSLLLFALILYLSRHKEKTSKTILTIIGSILGISIVGLNEIALIYLCAILFMWLALKIYINKHPSWSLIFIVGITFIAAGISMSAPGNHLRMSAVKADQFDLIFSLSGSLQLTFRALLGWVPLILLMVLIFWRTFERIAVQLKEIYNIPRIRIKYIFLMIIVLVGMVALGYFPTYWSQGGRPPTRTVNTIFLLFLFGSVGIILLYLTSREKIKWPVQKFHFFTQIMAVGIMLSYILFLSNNLRAGYKDIFYGSAARYDIELQERYERLSNCETGLCNIERLVNYPKTIFTYDLGLSPTDKIYYYNLCLQDYFHNTYSRGR
ncbi:hypothetical protein BH23BAC2_BH23BAC2_14350 [soil metagenome]